MSELSHAEQSIDAVRRKYALTKLAPGDYLVPSNDATTLWRVHSYEDGPTHGLDPKQHPADFTVWALRRWHEPLGTGSFVDVQDWERWELVADGLARRRDAINLALGLECRS